MATTRMYDGVDCPDCHSPNIRKDPYNDIEKRFCFDCLATWNHIPEDAEGRKAVKRRSTGEFRGGEMMQHSTMKIYAAFVAGFILGGLAVVL